MARPVTKNELLSAAESGYKTMNAAIEGLSEKEMSEPFNFSEDEKKKEAHWKRDKNVRDILIHLYEWHRLLINWVAANEKGGNTPFLPEPYNWKTYGEMNVKLWEKHQGTSLEDAKKMLSESHAKVMKLAEKFSETELFTKGAFKWTGASTLGSYFISNTSSHYNWAIKKLKAHIKNCRTK